MYCFVLILNASLANAQFRIKLSWSFRNTVFPLKLPGRLPTAEGKIPVSLEKIRVKKANMSSLS